MPLSTADLRKVLDFVGEAHGAGDLQELRTFLPSGLDGSVHVAIAVPEIPGELVAEWERYAYQNPLATRVARTRDGRAYRFSDVAKREELERLELFRDFYTPLGLPHQIAFTLPSPPHMTFALALSRGGRDYSDRDRDLLNLTRPHLIQAYRNVQARERAASLIEALHRGLDASGGAIAVVDLGSISFASPSAREQLRTLGWQGDSGAPSQLLDVGPTGRLWDPLLLASADGNVVVRRLPTGGRDSFFVIFEQARAGLGAATLRG